MNGNSGATPAPSAVPAEDAAQLITIACPACAAVLHKIKAEPGASVRCLNCGHRFTLDKGGGTGILLASTHGLEARATSQGLEAQPESAQPRSAGYWLLRIPAVVYTFAALAVTPFILYQMLQYGFFRSRLLEGLTQCSYVPLLGLGGLIWLFLTRALARVDSGAVHLGWRSGAIAHSLPPAPGSSLPYVAPVAVVGGVLPIIILSTTNTDDIGAVLLAGLVGGGLFYLGFMLEDVRQFCWRQEQLARSCFRAAGGEEREPQVSPYCGWLLGGAALLVAFAILMIFLDELRYRWERERLIPLFFSLGFVGIAYSLYLLGRDWDRAVAWWEMAAAQRSVPPQMASERRGWRMGLWGLGLFAVGTILFLLFLEKGHYYPYAYSAFAQRVLVLAGIGVIAIFLVLPAKIAWRGVSAMAAPTKAFCMVPWLWVVLGSFWVCLMLAKHGRPDGLGALGLLCAFGAAGAFAIWVSVFRATVSRWRAAQERFWLLWQPEAKPQRAPPPRWQWWIVWGTVWLAVIQAVLFSCMMLSNVFQYGPLDAETVLGFPLLVAMMHYPTMWCAMLLREFLALERLYETRRQDPSSGEGG